MSTGHWISAVICAFVVGMLVGAILEWAINGRKSCERTVKRKCAVYDGKTLSA